MKNDCGKSGVITEFSPFFTVIITTYNRCYLLKRALISLVNQKEKNWEAIILDDESSDDTELMVSKFMKNDSRILYYKMRHGGAVEALNNAIKLSFGQYITFLDSDDEYEPNHLLIRKELLSNFNSKLQFLYGGVKVIGNQFVPDINDISKQIHISKCTVGGTFVIDKLLFNKIGLFKKLSIGSDNDFYNRIVKFNIPSAEVFDQTYIYHREHEDSITHSCSKLK